MSKFCPIPWIFVAVRSNGDIRVCCQANASKSKGVYRKPNGIAFNVTTDKIDDARNSELAKEIRRTMLLDIPHEACIRCDREDASGVRSRRKNENELWQDTFTKEDALKVTQEDGTIDTSAVPVMYYDLRFGNLCNLKCRMCGPTDSSSWYDEYVKVWNNDTYDDSHGLVKLVLNDKGKYVPENNDYDWPLQNNFWNDIETNISNIRQIHTVGGEPLLIDQHYNLLKKCVDSGYAQNITIEYNSNITNIPEKAWNYWKKFRYVNIGASLDGVHEVNNYIRYPSKFWKIAENLRKLDESESNIRVWIAVTIQALNVENIPEMMLWVLKQNFKKIGVNHFRPVITPHLLHGPKYMSIKILPPTSKKRIEQKWKNMLPNIIDLILAHKYIICKDEFIQHTKKFVDSYVTYMYSDDASELLPKFYYYTTALDKIRKQKFGDIYPELDQEIREWIRRLQ